MQEQIGTGGEIQTPSQPQEANVAQPVDQSGKSDTDVVPSRDYKELQSHATARTQAAIAALAKLVQKDAAELALIQDTKLRDSVTKEVYGLDGYSEYVAIYGNNPVRKDSADGEASNEGQIELNKFKLENEKLKASAAISEFKAANPALFTKDSSEQKLREKMKLLSDSLSTEEKVKAAAVLAFGKASDDTSSAFKALAGMDKPVSGSSAPTEKQKDAKESNQEALLAFLGIKKSS